MRTINATFEDAEFNKILRAKKQSGKNNWREFILELVEKQYPKEISK